jgi:hypothetical protein
LTHGVAASVTEVQFLGTPLMERYKRVCVGTKVLACEVRTLVAPHIRW